MLVRGRLLAQVSDHTTLQKTHIMPDRHRNRGKDMKCIRVTKRGRVVRKWIPRVHPIEVEETAALPPPIEVEETEALPPPIEVEETASVPPPSADGRLLFPRAKPQLCDKCGESYPSITKFNAHRATCKKHKCSNCDLRFTTGQELKEHAGTHRIRFHCDECETEPFQSQSALVQHKKIAHDGVIACPHCAKTFNWAWTRDEHV